MKYYNKSCSFFSLLFLICLLAWFCPNAWAQTNKTGVTGDMTIDFGTRKNLDAEGKPVDGAKDVYTTNLIVSESVLFAGKIIRQPITLNGGWFKKSKASQFTYDLDIFVVNPSNTTQKRQVGDWVGAFPVTERGEYQLDAGSNGESKLRFDVSAIGRGEAFRDQFSGRIYGKGTQAKVGVQQFVRQLQGRQVKITVKQSDPLRFENVKLPKGPSGNYAAAVVNGDLIYDYETGNYLIQGLRISYNENGKDFVDTLSGSIKWVQDPGYDTNGKSWFDFNVRFNETDKVATEADAFAEMSDEAAFFAVDPSVASLTGTVNFEDTFIGSGDSRTVGDSRITYALTGNNLTKQQVLAFVKMWLLAVGPTNDE